MSQPKLAILVTCFNRRDLTVATLSAVPDAVAGSCQWQFIVVDDGSTDGTSDALKKFWPDAILVRGSGDLYWNGGMRLAWITALQLKPDFFLWLNDDTVLKPSSIADLITLYTQQSSPRTIVVGRTVDPESGEVTYGGYRREEHRFSRLRFRRLHCSESECDTMNGNCVLVPAAAAMDIGIHSVKYRHAYGDNDYGLRARRLGWKIIEMKQPVAMQSRNDLYAESIRKLTFQNWKFILFHPKGVAIAEWLAFCREHGGPAWPINFIVRYARMIKDGLNASLKSRD